MSSQQLERRFVVSELRAAKESRQVEGYALKFGTMSEDFGGWRETIDEDAEILWDDPRAFLNHDPNYLLGRLSNNTLSLKRDKTGILTVIDMPETQAGEDTLRLIRRGDISQMSFAFRTLPEGAVWDDRGGNMVRHLRAFRMFDVSPVSEPAYPDTQIWSRSLDLAKEEFTALRDREKTVVRTLQNQKMRELEALSLAARARSL
jgi:HK97 family phage prohead protease